MVPYYRKTPVLIARLLSALLLPLLRGAAVVLFRAPKNERTKILVQEGYRLGDVLLCSPALRHLRSTFPDAHIHLLSFAGGAALIRHAHWADRVITLTPFWAFSLSPTRALREWLRGVRLLRGQRYDLAIDLRGDPRGLSMLYCAGIHRRVSLADFGGRCFCSRAYRTPAHIKHQMTRCCWLAAQVSGSRVGDCTGPLWPPQPPTDLTPTPGLSDVLPPHGSSARLVFIHPGSSSARKFWPAERFARIIDVLTNGGAPCAMMGAKNDREQLRAIQALTHAPCPVFIPDFAQLEQLLMHASCVVCVDSFIQHAAWALHVPCVVLYGPGSPLQTAPLSGPYRIVWNDTVLSPPYASWSRPRDVSCNRENTVVAGVRELIGLTSG